MQQRINGMNKLKLFHNWTRTFEIIRWSTVPIFCQFLFGFMKLGSICNRLIYPQFIQASNSSLLPYYHSMEHGISLCTTKFLLLFVLIARPQSPSLKLHTLLVFAHTNINIARGLNSINIYGTGVKNADTDYDVDIDAGDDDRIPNLLMFHIFGKTGASTERWSDLTSTTA